MPTRSVRRAFESARMSAQAALTDDVMFSECRSRISPIAVGWTPRRPGDLSTVRPPTISSSVAICSETADWE